MAVTKRDGSKYWYIQFQYNGKTYIKSSKSTDKNLAERLEASWRNQLIEQQQLGIKSPIEVAKAFQMFANAKQTLKSNKYITLACKRVTAYWTGITYIHQVTTRDIEGWRLELQSRGYGNQSIKHMLNQVSGTIKYVKRMGYQTSDFEMPKIKLSKGRLRYLTHDEERRLLHAIDPTRDVKWMAPYEDRREALKAQMQDFHDLVILLLDTGARHGEICTLQWGSINLSNRTIGLWRPKVRNESVLYMTDRVYEVLTRRHANPFNQFVFNDKKGLARNNVHLTFKKAFERAGITGCTAHTLRHTHATRLIQNGLNLYEVKEILGHADIQTTMRYAHIEQAKVSLKARDVINQLNSDHQSTGLNDNH